MLEGLGNGPANGRAGANAETGHSDTQPLRLSRRAGAGSEPNARRFKFVGDMITSLFKIAEPRASGSALS